MPAIYNDYWLYKRRQRATIEPWTMFVHHRWENWIIRLNFDSRRSRPRPPAPLCSVRLPIKCRVTLFSPMNARGCDALFDDYSLRLNYGRLCVKTDQNQWLRRTKRILFYLFNDCENLRIGVLFFAHRHTNTSTLNVSPAICEQFDYLFLIRNAASVRHRINRKWPVKHLREQMYVFFSELGINEK